MIQPKDIVTAVGGRFSRELGIDLSGGESGEIFGWFLASVLYGARISGTIVKHTVREFQKAQVLSPDSIIRTGWDGLVAILDRGGYVRYDFKTAAKLLDIANALNTCCAGDLNRLHAAADGPQDLEAKLKALAKGVGGVTVNIFLRELRGVWSKADPVPSDLAVASSRGLGIIPSTLEDKRKILDHLKKKWNVSGGRGKDFMDFEAALIRVGRDYCRNGACFSCLFKADCPTGQATGGHAGRSRGAGTKIVYTHDD